MQNVFNRLGWILAGLVSLFVIAAITGIVHGGPLDPPAAPGSTQPQVEPRSPIPPVGWSGTFPIVISQPGSYFLTQDLTGVATTDGVQIAASGVTIDLNGFAIIGSSGGRGIDVTVNATNIAIRNGAVRGGWGTGIFAADADRSSFEALRISNNANGIITGSGALIRGVTAESNTSGGIQIDDNHLIYAGGLVTDSVSTANAVNLYVFANNVRVVNSVFDSSTQDSVVLHGAFDVLTDNSIQGTNTGYCIGITGNSNTIARNVIGNCASGQIHDTGSGNRVGPATIDLTSTQPWSNAEY